MTFSVPVELKAKKGGKLMKRDELLMGIVVATGLAFLIILLGFIYSPKITGSGGQTESEDSSTPIAEAETEPETHTERKRGLLPTAIAGFPFEKVKEIQPEQLAVVELVTETETLPSDTNYAINTILMEPGKTIDPVGGVFQGPWLKETYYNLNMDYCIEIMRWLGIGESYSVWVRSDGVKMYGDYVMCAADTGVFPKGSIVETSLGTAMVVDHCEAAEWCPEFDIAVTW